MKRMMLGVLVLSACVRAPVMGALEKRKVKSDATAAYDRKDWATCSKQFQRLDDWYSSACCAALAGEKDRAFDELGRASRQGEFGSKQLEGDDDLVALRADPRWQATVKSFQDSFTVRQAGNNHELREIVDADQADRQGPNLDWATVGPRDQAREKRVNEILAVGGAKTSADYFAAAMVYQHGTTPAQAMRAHELALKAVELDPNNDTARWLSAASEDRALMYEKKPQKYGTQFSKQGETWVLWEVDPTITDEQRAAWNVPTLEEAKARAVKLNATGGF
jgi:hypothetical protein